MKPTKYKISKFIRNKQIEWAREGRIKYGFILGAQSKQKDVLRILDEMYEKKKLSLKELGLSLEDWWGESEMFSVNELEELKKRIEQK